MFDFLESNYLAECHIGNDVIDSWDEILREWRQMSAEMSIIDLKSTYLQIKIIKDFWKYQIVKYKKMY